MIDNDDKAVGDTFTPDIYEKDGNLIQPHTGPVFNHEFFEHPGFPGLDYETECRSSGETVTAKFTNCTLSGSFYNATGYRGVGDGPRGQGEPLYMTLGQEDAQSPAECRKLGDANLLNFRDMILLISAWKRPPFLCKVMFLF